MNGLGWSSAGKCSGGDYQRTYYSREKHGLEFETVASEIGLAIGLKKGHGGHGNPQESI
jgi:hypothetical protein